MERKTYTIFDSYDTCSEENKKSAKENLIENMFYGADENGLVTVADENGLVTVADEYGKATQKDITRYTRKAGVGIANAYG